MQFLTRRQFGLGFLAAGMAATTLERAKAQSQAETMNLAIDEGSFVEINGMEQWITMRGRDRANPVLLLLHGGPGFPMSWMAPAFAAWERDYTLVQWDQPAGGSTYGRNVGRDQGPLTIDRYVRDGIAVVEHVLRHLGKDRLVLMGTSWGTVLGVTMIQRRPELFSAYVGTSQAVSGPEGLRIGYELGLAAARARGDATAVAALERVGPPPYARFEDFMVRAQYTNPPALPPGPREAAALAAQGALMATPPAADARYIARGLPQQDFPSVFIQAQMATWAETWAWEARSLGMDYGVPVFVIQGEDDLNTPVSLARTWFDEIRAPAKAMEVIPGAGHNVLAFSDEVLAFLNHQVRPLATGAARPTG